MSESIDWQALWEAAQTAQRNAYAPYSQFQVGAALLAEDGRVFSGANVENISYGLTQCAERNAIGAAVSAGARSFRALLILSSGPRAARPCGACRQVLGEFRPPFPVRCVSSAGDATESDTEQLLPDAFGPDAMG